MGGGRSGGADARLARVGESGGAFMSSAGRGERAVGKPESHDGGLCDAKTVTLICLCSYVLEREGEEEG